MGYLDKDGAGRLVGNTKKIIPGRNILDNSDFVHPVNQREVSGTISTAGYCIDRWKLISGSITLAADGITLNGSMAQILRFAAGTDVTASVGMVSGTATAAYNNATKTLTITSTGGKIKWVKLETGGVATPYLPKGYGVELNECMMYYQKNYYSLRLTNNSVAITFKPTMRLTPTVTINMDGASATPTTSALSKYGTFVQIAGDGYYAFGSIISSADL